jgi:butyryl-CoA dehydrogenase
MSSSACLSPEHAQLQEAVREFARRDVAPRAAEIDRSAEFPHELVRKMQELGIFGICVPEEYGGTAADHTALLLAVEELAVASGAVANIAMVQSCYTELLARSAAPEIAKEWVPAAVRGEKLLAVCMTEPHTGSDAAAITTTARRDGDNYVIAGQKQFITMGTVADGAVVFARTAEGRRDAISCFFVDLSTPGVNRLGHDDLLGMRGQATGGIAFDDVVVPAGNLLGEEGKGFAIAMRSFEVGRLVIGALAVGLARAATEAAAAYAKERVAFGRSISTFQGVSFPIADMHARTTAARLVLQAGAARLDAGQPFTMEASIGKLLASDAAMAAATDSLQVHGGMGYSMELPVQRIFRDAKLTQIYEGTNQIQRHIIANLVMSQAT